MDMTTRMMVMGITTTTIMSDKPKTMPLVKAKRARKPSLNLAPCAGRGRIASDASNPGEGGPPETMLSDNAPHPARIFDARHPLPASGARDHTTPGRGDAAALYRLMAWLSPSFPVGAFSYSSGIEWAVEAGDIRDAATLSDWLSLMMSDGAGYCDAVLFVQADRAVRDRDAAKLRDVAELAAAFSPSKERHLETTAQGRAFLLAVRAAWPCEALDMLEAAWDGPIAYPVAVATACAGHGIAADAALPAFLHAIAANWISAGVRLIPLGQTDGQRVLAALENIIAITAARALSASLDDIGGAALRADIGSMRHETQYTRLFRS